MRLNPAGRLPRSASNTIGAVALNVSAIAVSTALMIARITWCYALTSNSHNLPWPYARDAVLLNARKDDGRLVMWLLDLRVSGSRQI